MDIDRRSLCQESSKIQFALIAAKLTPVLGQLAPVVPGLAEKLDIKNLQIPGQDDFYRTSIAAGVGVSIAF